MKILFAMLLSSFWSNPALAVEVASDGKAPLPKISLRVDTFDLHPNKAATLGDFLSCQGEGSFCDAVLMHPLASLVQEGFEQQVITPVSLQGQLTNLFPHIELSIEPFTQVVLQLNKKEVNEDDLLTKIAQLCNDFNRSNPDVNIEPMQLQMLQRTKLTAGVAQIQFPDLEQRFATDLGIDVKAFRTPLRIGVVLTLDDDRATQVRWSAMVRFAARVRLAVFKRTVFAGDVITGDDLHVTWKPLDEIGFQAVAAEEDAIGKTSRLTYRPGDIPRSAQLYKPLLVKFGEEVEVMVGSDDMRVATRGRSAGQGGLGDRISITIANGKKKMFGKVIGAGKVEVVQ